MKLTYRVFIVVFLSAFVSELTGCEEDQTTKRTEQGTYEPGAETSKKMTQPEEVPSTTAEKTGEVLDDSAITAKIKTQFLGDPALKATQIEVTTTNGVVRLSGVVDNRQNIDKAVSIARSVNNVRSVENNLVVDRVPK